MPVDLVSNLINYTALAKFLGWALVVNTLLFTFATGSMILLKGPMGKLHAHLFGMSEEAVLGHWYMSIAFFKVLIIFFNLVPYIVCRWMAI